MSASAKKTARKRVTSYKGKPKEGALIMSASASAMSEFIAGNHEFQKMGLSPVFDWQWFLTMTSKDVMTLEGSRKAVARYIGLLSSEIAKDEFTVFWVSEPHNQGKQGYHLHMLIAGVWPVPKNKPWLPVAQILDDVWQRSMGLAWDGYNEMWRTRSARPSDKHRFRAVPYAPQFANYCAKYLTKGSALWEFARVSSNYADTAHGLSKVDNTGEVKRDRSGNWDKADARRRTKQAKRTLRFRNAESVTTYSHLVDEAKARQYEYARMRGMVTNDEVEIEWWEPQNNTVVL